MRFLALGVDHRSAPTSVREALAFDGDKLEHGLRRLASEFPGLEAVVISTCNRVELHLAADDLDGVPHRDEAARFLSRFHQFPLECFAAHLRDYADEQAVRHLFRVAASLESLVLGEGQILGQVKEAYQAAITARTVGPILHSVFQNALRVGKKVREVTGLDQGKVSVASVAVDLARDVFDSFADKTVLVIGAGKMAELTLAHLAALKPGRVVVVNRNPERARLMAARFQGETRPLDQLPDALIEADLVVSTTASDQPIVEFDLFSQVQRARRNRLALILDLAIPRDFEASIGELDQVLLYNVDDLNGQAELNRRARRQGIETAQAIIESETLACLNALRHQRAAGELQRMLGARFDEIRQRELERLFAARPDLDEADRQAIAHMAHRLQNQFLHQPRAALRSAVAETQHGDQPHPILTAVRHLVGLGPHRETVKPTG